MKIVFLDRETISVGTILRSPCFSHEWVNYESSSAREVSSRIADAHIVVTNKTKISASDLSGATSLSLIAVAATGTDIVDISAALAAGIVVSNVRGYAVHAVPEHTFALLFALRRNLLAYRDSIRSGRWQAAGRFCFFDHPIRDLYGSQLGIVGNGAIGQAVAAIGRSLGMRIVTAARKGCRAEAPDTEFEKVLRESDVISLHCPLTPDTRNLIGDREFQLMQRQPILINTSRGGLVDERALCVALENGQIAGAGFDVVSDEPPSLDHPFMKLLTLPNFMLTPHVAWASEQAMQVLADQLIENIEAFYSGNPQNVVNG